MMAQVSVPHSGYTRVGPALPRYRTVRRCLGTYLFLEPHDCLEDTMWSGDLGYMRVVQVSLECKKGEAHARAEPVVYTLCLDGMRPCDGGGIPDGSHVGGTTGRRGDTLDERL